MTNSELKNKYYLGALTLRDLEDKIKGLDVVVDHVHYRDWGIGKDRMLFWYEEIDDEEEDPDFELSLDLSVKLQDGKVCVYNPVLKEEYVLSFGKMEFKLIPMDVDE